MGDGGWLTEELWVDGEGKYYKDDEMIEDIAYGSGTADIRVLNDDEMEVI